MKVFMSVAFASCILSIVDVNAQECAAGPQCVAKGKSMMSVISKQQARLGNGASEAALGAFCVNWAQAELARFCGDELKKLGKQSCADLAYQQQAENKRVAVESAKSAQAFVTSGINISRPGELYKKECR